MLAFLGAAHGVVKRHAALWRSRQRPSNWTSGLKTKPQKSHNACELLDQLMNAVLIRRHIYIFTKSVTHILLSCLTKLKHRKDFISRLCNQMHGRQSVNKPLYCTRADTLKRKPAQMYTKLIKLPKWSPPTFAHAPQALALGVTPLQLLQKELLSCRKEGTKTTKYVRTAYGAL